MASTNLTQFPLPKDDSFFKRHPGWGLFWKIAIGMALMLGAVNACIAILTNLQKPQYIYLSLIVFSIIICLSLLVLNAHYFLDMKKQNKILQALAEFHTEEIEILISPMPQIAQERYRKLSLEFKQMAGGDLLFFRYFFVRALRDELPEFFLNIK